MMATVAVVAATAGLAAFLLGLYVQLYRRVPAPFTGGLTIFAGLFLVQNVVALLSFLFTIAIVPDALAPLLLIIGLLEFAGLAAITWIARH